MTLYLASRSPRRTRLLKEAGIRHRVLKTNYKERRSARLTPAVLVRKHAMGKAMAAAVLIKNGLILAADTVVFCKGKIIGKPRSRREAEKTLLSLQGRRHTVYTGVALIAVDKKNLRKKILFYEKTGVRLKKMDLSDIRRYFRRINPMDKAGAYAIQAKKGSIVREIRGSFSNAVGLPMERLCARMRKR